MLVLPPDTKKNVKKYKNNGFCFTPNAHKSCYPLLYRMEMLHINLFFGGNWIIKLLDFIEIQVLLVQGVQCKGGNLRFKYCDYL